MGSALLFHFFYADPGTGEHPDFSLALYTAFALIFFETILPYPEQGFFQILFFVLPVLGLTTVINGVLQIGSAIVPCTDDELRNLDIALEARELCPEIKVVMRMFDADLARRVEKGFGIHTAFSTSALAAPVFASAAMQLDVKHSFYVEDRLLIISEIVVADVSSLHGMAVGELEEAYDPSVVCSVIDATAELHPEGTHALIAGEKLFILSSRESMEEVQQLNRPLK